MLPLKTEKPGAVVSHYVIAMLPAHPQVGNVVVGQTAAAKPPSLRNLCWLSTQVSPLRRASLSVSVSPCLPICLFVCLFVSLSFSLTYSLSLFLSDSLFLSVTLTLTFSLPPSLRLPATPR